MIETKKIFLLFTLTWMWMVLSTKTCGAQSGELQLNLLLESNKTMDWTREYQVVIADQIPATIFLGKLKGENTVIGILRTTGLGDRLVLHGIQTQDRFNLHEWVDNSHRSGELEIVQSENNLTGYWYNQDRTIRLSIQSKNHNLPYEIRQYQNDKEVFFTIHRNESEELMGQTILTEKNWKDIHRPHQKCYDVRVNNRMTDFCRTGVLNLYSYNRIDLVRILHGLVPQIPHDQVFNSQISGWLEEWALQIFQDSTSESGDERWSQNQAIWFIPDYITDDLISGLLSIQYSGDRLIHSKAVIYDRQKNVFYGPEDFFRSHTGWGNEFQEYARKTIYEVHAKTIDVFPEVMERLKFHLTLTPKGILISSDFTPYFGRLTAQLKYKDFQEDLQRFAPFRKLFPE